MERKIHAIDDDAATNVLRNRLNHHASHHCPWTCSQARQNASQEKVQACGVDGVSVELEVAGVRWDCVETVHIVQTQEVRRLGAPTITE